MRPITALRADGVPVGELSRLTDVNIETIRYYEKIKMLPAPARTKGGHRVYGPKETRILVFIRRGRELGFTLDQIRALPKVTQNTRHVCVEGWDVIGSFGGVRISDFLASVGADATARFLAFECADDYYESLDMATALHPNSLLCYEMYGKPLDRGHGAPLRLSLPTKLGYKSAKYLTTLEITSVLRPNHRAYWADLGYSWFAGL